MIRGNLNARKIPLMCKMPWNVIQERDSRYIAPRNGAPPDLKGQQGKPREEKDGRSYS